MFYDFKNHRTDMNPNPLHSCNYYNELYKVVASHHRPEKSEKLTLGKGIFHCRFCGRNKPDVTFKKTAHAVPEFMGNRTLFSHWECDECNGLFGRILESQFSAFMHLNHTLYGISGKNGFPKYKTNDGTSIETTGTFIEWKGVPDKNIKFEPEKNMVHITQKMPSFVPIAVYKTLVKIALTIIPEIELQYFKDTLNWLREDNHLDSKFNLPNLWMLYGWFESSECWDQLSTVVSKKRNIEDHTIPYMLFSLSYGYFNFQLPIPLCSQDGGRTFDYSSITYLPHLIDLKYGSGKMKIVAQNMSFKEQIVGNELTFTIIDLDGSGNIAQINDAH